MAFRTLTGTVLQDVMLMFKKIKPNTPKFQRPFGRDGQEVGIPVDEGNVDH